MCASKTFQIFLFMKLSPSALLLSMFAQIHTRSWKCRIYCWTVLEHTFRTSLNQKENKEFKRNNRTFFLLFWFQFDSISCLVCFVLFPTKLEYSKLWITGDSIFMWPSSFERNILKKNTSFLSMQNKHLFGNWKLKIYVFIYYYHVLCEPNRRKQIQKFSVRIFFSLL